MQESKSLPLSSFDRGEVDVALLRANNAQDMEKKLARSGVLHAGPAGIERGAVRASKLAAR